MQLQIRVIASFKQGLDQQWGCLFGEIEVAAKLGRGGFLECLTPPQEEGLVNFMVTWNSVPYSTSVKFMYIVDFESSFKNVVVMQMKFASLMTPRHRIGGVTTLHLAAAGGYSYAIQLLVVPGYYDINHRDSNGCTALHWACAFGRSGFANYCTEQLSSSSQFLHPINRLNVVEILLQAGAAPQPVASLLLENGTREETTPTKLAERRGHQEVADYLLNYVRNRQSNS